MADDDLGGSAALVIDGNQTSRSILVSQLRDFGMGEVAQSPRIAHARQLLESRAFDVVLCEQDFDTPGDSSTGQDLLDDLRRNQLLPFSTVFIMVTAQATYAKVAEAAESALDAYLLKPHTATGLALRLRQARHRKLTLQAIFSAIEQHEFDRAARMCVDRFKNRDDYWLYSARVGAELMMRTGQHQLALALYEGVVKAKGLPWAKLGIARVVMETGKMADAKRALQKLIQDDPTYAEAHDVLAGVRFEQGNYTEALDSCRESRALTPGCIGRNQSFGMMSFYVGNHKDAVMALTQAVTLGFESKVFDAQSLVLLALCHLEAGDPKGFARAQGDMRIMLAKNPQSVRLGRFSALIAVMDQLFKRDQGAAYDALARVLPDVSADDFDYSTACDVLALLAELAERGTRRAEMETAVDALALRFGSSRPLSDLLARMAAAHAPYAERVRHQYAELLKLSEAAMQHSLDGDPARTVEALMVAGERTQNPRLLDTAHQVLQRYAAQLGDGGALRERCAGLRQRFCTAGARPSLGEQRERQAGRLSLRTAVVAPGATALAPPRPVVEDEQPAAAGG